MSRFCSPGPRRRAETRCIILLESMWRDDADPKIADSTRNVTSGSSPPATTCTRCHGARVRVIVADARRGNNMFALGMLCNLYSLELQLAREHIALAFGKKARWRVQDQRDAARSCYAWRKPTSISVFDPAVRRPSRSSSPTATRRWRFGVLASGWKSADVSDHARHFGFALSLRCFEKVGGVVPRPRRNRRMRVRDRCVLASKCTVRSLRPGYSLKQEAIGLAVMAEIPLVVATSSVAGRRRGSRRRPSRAICDRDVGSPATRRKSAGGGNDRGLLLLDHYRAQDRRDVQLVVVCALGRHLRDVADAVSATRVQRLLWVAPPLDQSPLPPVPSLTTGTRPPPSAAASSRPTQRHAYVTPCALR